MPPSTTAVPTTTVWSNGTTEGRVCTPVMVTAPPTDDGMPEALPVPPTNYISEYVRLRVGEFFYFKLIINGNIRV